MLMGHLLVSSLSSFVEKDDEILISHALEMSSLFTSIIKFNNGFINQRVDEDINLDFFEMIMSTNELAKNLVDI
jgi:hypothetical protein